MQASLKTIASFARAQGRAFVHVSRPAPNARRTVYLPRTCNRFGFTFWHELADLADVYYRASTRMPGE